MLVETRHNLKLLEKSISHLKILQKSSKLNTQKAISHFLHKAKQKYFSTLQLKLIPKILQKSKIQRFQKKLQKKFLFNTLKSYLKYHKQKALIDKFSEYHKKLCIKSLFSLKIRVLKKNNSKSLHSRIKWVLFHRNCKIMKQIFTYWKFIHRIRYILIAQILYKLEKSLNIWKFSVF